MKQTDLADVIATGNGAAVPDPDGLDAGDRQPSPKGRLRNLAALAGLVALLAFLWGRGRHVWYWIDEGISIGIASQPLTSIPDALRQDGAPPLYYMTLHGWISLFGSSEPATHVLSLVFALATVPAALWAGWSLFGRRTGWTFAALAALNPFVAEYANETRMYSLVVLLGILTIATFGHACVFGRRRYLPAFVASLTLLLYTHNWGLLLGVGLASAVALLALISDSTDRRRVVVDGILGFGAVGLLYLPWVPTLLYQLDHGGAPFLLRPTLLRVREDLITLVGNGEAEVAILGVVAVLGLMGLMRRPWNRSATTVVSVLAVVAVTVVVGWLVSRQSSIWFTRYLAVLVGPILLVLALGVARGGQLAVAGLVVYGFLAAPVGVKGQPFEKSNVKEIAQGVEDVLQPGDLVVASFGRAPVLSHYLPPGLRYAETTGLVPNEALSDQRDGVARLQAAEPQAVLPPLLDTLPPGGHVLVVCPPPSLLRPDDTVFVELISSRCQESIDVVAAHPEFSLEAAVLADDQEYGMAPEDGYLFTKPGI